MQQLRVNASLVVGNRGRATRFQNDEGNGCYAKRVDHHPALVTVVNRPLQICRWSFFSSFMATSFFPENRAHTTSTTAPTLREGTRAAPHRISGLTWYRQPQLYRPDPRGQQPPTPRIDRAFMGRSGPKKRKKSLDIGRISTRLWVFSRKTAPHSFSEKWYRNAIFRLGFLPGRDHGPIIPGSAFCCHRLIASMLIATHTCTSTPPQMLRVFSAIQPSTSPVTMAPSASGNGLW